MRKFATALFVGACVFGLAACGGGGGSDKVQVGKDGKKVTISGGKSGADISVGGGELPDGFPKSDVPLPSDNKSDIIAAGTVTASGTQTWTVSYKVGKDGAKAYKAKLEDAGFKADSSYTGSGDNTSSSFYSLKSAKYDVNVIGGTDKNQSTLVITVTPNKDSSSTTTTDSSSSGDSGSSGGSGN
jgi:hypothetical protein